jgi:hypothetical protein
MYSRVCIGTALLLSGLFAPKPAHADPVVITSGSASAYWDQSLSGATLFGDGFSVSGNGRGSSPASWTVGQIGNLAP